MAFQGDGVCRDLKLQTKPDASGSISVHFTVKLGNFSHDYALRVLVLANNDAPAFRFNCSRTLLRHPAEAVSYTHLRAHETRGNLVCRLLLEKKKNKT